jgi:hypothetical protein
LRGGGQTAVVAVHCSVVGSFIIYAAVVCDNGGHNVC